VHFAEGSVIVPPIPSSSPLPHITSASPPAGSTSPRPAITVKDVLNGQDSGDEGKFVLLRAHQLYLMTLNMPIEKLQALINYATSLGEQGNES